MEELKALVAQLRELADESRDLENKDFYHNAGNSAYFAAAFDDLDAYMTAKNPDWPEK